MLSSCLAAVHSTDASVLEDVRRRFGTLVSFYEPLGTSPVNQPSLNDALDLNLLFGRIDFADGARASANLSWGERLPPRFSSPDEILDASDAELRSIEGSLAAFSIQGQRGCLVTGGGPVTSLYVASGARCTAWSTHAVAAAWLANGEVKVDSGAIPELLSLEFVSGNRTLVQGVSAVPPGTRVDFSASGASTRPYWSRAERWQAISEDDAHAEAESALLRGLSTRVDGEAPTYLGLTDGADSRVVACALAELGLPFASFTWGDQDWADVKGAQRVAELLGISHEVLRPDYMDAGRAFEENVAQARWTEGALPISFVRSRWPEEMRTFVTGAGAESGRAFYYHRLASADGDQETDWVAQEFRRAIEGRLRGARAETRKTVGRRMEALVREAADLGYEGWRCLDVLYGEQRVRRWARAHLPCRPTQLVPAFGTPDVMRALACLPLHDRLSNGFNRRFLAERMPDLVLPAPAPALREQRSGIRRSISDALPGSVHRTVTRLRASRAPSRPWLFADRWEEYSALRAWIAEEALESPALRESMGKRWTVEVRDGFLAGEDRATAIALLAASPAALAHALQELR